ncbi:MAG: TonB-dependent receptor [Gammaproteobacteria bacterium]|nr:MAG: TonB-dependent receptor [Gammaproteobacteria bacterium]
MKIKSILYIIFGSSLLLSGNVFSADEEEENARDRGGIEEITVTAEKRTSTVSDTSMSITAFDSSLLEDLGMQGADDLMDQLPATTRDAYDVRIRGVGRNFRALGGDPGVATYYNGVYSPDFGIAASENYLYDVERIEVLRGPQGTLYGRNSIGGAINYITKKPNFNGEGEVRAVLGDYGVQQYYFLSSAPITENIAYRLNAISVENDGLQKNIGTGPDANSGGDENIVMTLLWNITDDMSFQIRANDRLADRVIGQSVLLNEGYGNNRGSRDTANAVYGLRPVAEGTPGAMMFTNTITGTVAYGAPRRAGVDPVGFPWRYNPMYGRTDAPSVIGTYQVDGNHDTNCEDFPYGPPACDSRHVKFDQRGQQAKFEWDINDTTTITYLYGAVDFEYMFNIDNDFTNNSTFSQYRATVLEDVHMNTHEININWTLGEDIEVTSGVFFMDENRQQTYSLNNNVPAILDAADYGLLDTTFGTVKALTGIQLDLPGAPFEYYTQYQSLMSILGWASNEATPHVRAGDAPLGSTITGRWQGDSLGRVYGHENEVQTDAVAYFTQGTWTINDQLALTLGARYAEDEKEATEITGGYAELYAYALAPYLPVVNLLAGQPYIPVGADATPAAHTNVAMGNASFNFDPALVALYTSYAGLGLVPAGAVYPLSLDVANPLTPTCDMTAESCANPLRLGQGIPYSYTRNIKGENTWSDTNFRINLDYTPNDYQLFYFGMTTGYRSGGFALGVSGQRDDARDENGVPNGTGQILVDYDQEEVTAVEFGYKGLHLNDTLQIFASIYQYDYDGYQDELEQFDPIRGGGTNIVSNADGITNEGFEIEMNYAASDRLTLAGNYSYTKTEYGEDYNVFMTDDPVNPVPVFGQCTQDYVSCSVVNEAQAAEYTVNLKGGPLKGIPETKFTLRATYEMDSRWGPIWLLINHSYTGDFSASGIQRELDRIESRERTNLSASWWSEDGKVSVRAYINNVMDNEAYYALSTSGHENNYTQNVTPLAPRTMGMDLRYKF